MAAYLASHGVKGHELKGFLLRQASRLKEHARRMADRERRPFQYFGTRVHKEQLARQIAERDGIQEGLVCVFSTLEPCRSFALRWNKPSYVQSARRKCLFLYYYFMDREFGLIHVRVQTWFPLPIQVYVNGHEWLARKLARHGVRYTKQDNAFLAVEDYRRAQTFADRFASLDWVGRLDRWARTVNPLLPEILAPMTYYWVTTQAEYATDVVFKSPRHLQDLMPRLLNRFVLRSPTETAPDESGERAEAPTATALAPGEALTGGDLERAIAESWRRVLGRDRIEANDNFFELGGDSLTALQAMAVLKAALGREIPIVTLYESPTVGRLARALAAEKRADETPVDLGDVGQRAGTRLEMMQRRRRARTGPPGSQEPT